MKNLQETQDASLGWEDPLEEEMATHSSILVWEITWIEEPGELQSMGLQRIGHDIQYQCTILVAWGWCTGTTQRDGMGREEGGGFRMGSTCIPVVDSF